MASLIPVLTTIASAQPTGQWLQEPQDEFPGLAGVAHAAVRWDPDGAEGPLSELLVVGGEFSAAGGILASNVAAFDGVGWRSLGQGLSGNVTALAVYQGTLIAGGLFPSPSGSTPSLIAAWDGRAWQPLSPGLLWSPGNDGVERLIVYRNELIVAGMFTGSPGVSSPRFIRWDGTRWRELPTGWTNQTELFSLSAMIVHFDELYICGRFSTIGGAPCANAARWNGARWAPMSAASGAGLSGLAVLDGWVYSAMNYFGGSGSYGCNMLRWNGVTWDVFPSNRGVGASGLYSLNGTLYLADEGVYPRGLHEGGGVWRLVGTQLERLVTLRGGVSEVTQFQGRPVALGYFSHYANSNRRGSGVSWRTNAGWTPLGRGTGMDAEVTDAAFRTDGLYTARGRFVDGASSDYLVLKNGTGSWTNAGSSFPEAPDLTGFGQRLLAQVAFPPSITEWNGASWTPSQAFAQVSRASLFATGGELYAVGDGTIYRYAGATWEPMATIDGMVYAIEATAQGIVVAGSFRPGGEAATWYAGLLTPSGWQNRTGGLNGSVRNLCTFAGAVHASGDFTRSHSTPLVGVARLEGEYWQALGSGIELAPGGTVGPLASHRGELFIAGRISRAGDIPVRNIARWDGESWRALGEGIALSPNDRIVSLVSDGDDLTVAGHFNNVDGRAAPNVARWRSSALCAADRNEDGGVDGEDLSAFFDAWQSGQPSADINRDRRVDGQDVQAFFELWQAGC